MNKTDKKIEPVKAKKVKVEKKVNLKQNIRRIPEFKGVVFWDITTLLKDPALFKETIKQLADHYRGKKIDVIVSNEARGFIIGAPLAYRIRRRLCSYPQKRQTTIQMPRLHLQDRVQH